MERLDKALRIGSQIVRLARDLVFLAAALHLIVN
ncbi:MAG: hypothetical protein QOI11_2339 [Candidatus Eremiobacteraeota bacterium]|jgi:hypothetical protein|nr:hypothetical protein [Candidatus Eremiobacteraeota bacterium]